MKENFANMGKEMGIAMSKAMTGTKKENRLYTVGIKPFHPESHKETDKQKYETDIRRFERRMNQLLDTETVTEEVKVKTLMGLTRGTARMLLDNKYVAGYRTVDEMMRTLRGQFDYQDTATNLCTKLQNYKRYHGETLASYKIKLEDKAQELIERDGARYAPLVKQIIWNKVTGELPESLNWKVTKQFDESTLERAMEFINEYIAFHPIECTLSDTNLKKERKRNENSNNSSRDIKRNTNYKVNSVETTREEEEEANMHFTCYGCGEEGHMQKDCAKDIKQTVTGTKAAERPKYQNEKRKWVSKPQEGSNRTGDQQRRRPKCILCRKDGHTLTRCFIFERAQKLLKTTYGEKDIRNFKRINNNNKDDKRLDDLKVKFMQEIDWTGAEDTTVDMAINCLLDEEELYEVDLLSDKEGPDEGSDDEGSRNEDLSDREEGEEESDY